MDATLLYIDPDPAVRLLVQRALDRDAFAVHQATGAPEGQEVAARLRPDLILVDVDRVRAAELIPALRGLPGLGQARLLAATADARPEHTEKLLTWGFDRVWLHPLDIDTLADDLRLALQPVPEALPVPPPVAAPPEARDEGTALAEGDAALHADAVAAVDVGDAVEEAATARVDASDGPADGGAMESGASLAATPGSAGGEAVAPAGGADVVALAAAVPEPLAAAPDALPPLAPVDVPPLWGLALTPLLAQLARSTAAADGVLALLDETGEALTVVAVVGRRGAGAPGALAGDSAVGRRVRAAGAPWLEPALRGAEVVTIAADAPAAGSPLVPAGSQALLAVPVASRDRVRGVAVLGKHRGGRGPAFAAGKAARTLIHAQQIGGVVDALECLDRAAGDRRRELEALRSRSLRAVLAEVTALARPPRRSGAEPPARDNGHAPDPVAALGLEVADQLALPARARETLRQALDARDVGRAWIEQALFARAQFSAGGRERLLETAALHGAEILSALDWPADVVALVRSLGAGDDADAAGDGDAPDLSLEARVLGVVCAYGGLVAGPAAEDPEAGRAVALALAEMCREGAHRYDPAAAEALAAIVSPASAAAEDVR